MNCSLTLQVNDILCLETEGSNTYTVELGANNGHVVAKHLIEHFGVVVINAVPSPSGTAVNVPPATAVNSTGTPGGLLFPVLLAGDNANFVVTPEGYLDAFANQAGARLWSKRLIGMPGLVNLTLEA